MKKVMCALLLMLLAAFVRPARSQESYEQRLRRFDYDRTAPLDLKETGVVRHDGAKVYDISYASLKGGRVSAYLVVPEGRGPFAAIVFGHWAMPGSAFANRTEFLDEAVAYARAGAVSLLIDAPLARPGFIRPQGPFNPQEVENFFQQLMDLRRGVDLLVARKDVDPARIAYVGHSYNANAGGVLAGVEKRIRAFVLMAGGLADEEALRSNDPKMVELRRSVGEEKIERIIRETRWLDPANYVGHASPSAVLLQYGRQDGDAGEARAERYLQLVSEPKELKLYDAGHALNALARRDRFEWLRKQLGLRRLDPRILGRVKEIK